MAEKHDERLAAGFKSEDIVREVKQAKEIDSTFRVYRKEWLFFSRHGSLEEAVSHAQEKFGDRLEEGDLKTEPEDGSPQATVWTRRWNVAGEWKTEELAVAHRQRLIDAGTPAEDTALVTKNSRDEFKLKNYGVLKLKRPVKSA